MYVVGVIEIVAGLVVLLKPRFGGYLVSAWLAGIIVNLLLIGDYYDIALRDFGLLLAALTLARLSTAFPSGATRDRQPRSEEHTSELQSLMRISYAVFCLKKNTTT